MPRFDWKNYGKKRLPNPKRGLLKDVLATKRLAERQGWFDANAKTLHAGFRRPGSQNPRK